MNLHDLVSTPRGKGRIIALSVDKRAIRVRHPGARGYREYPMSDVSVVHKAKKKDKSWKFKVMNSSAIDWDLVIEDLNRDNPIQLITMNEQRYVAVHHTLFMKADDIDMTLPAGLTSIELKGATIFITPGHFSAWVDWARKVKSAKWVNRNPCTVEISMPSI